MRPTRASACPHLAPAEYEDLAPPRARSPHRPRCAPLRTCTPERREREESVLPPRSAGFGRAQSVPRRVRRAYPHTRSRSLQRRRRTPRPRTAAALRTNVPRSPAHRIPASTGTWRIPERATRPYRAGLVPVPPSAARAPRSRHPPPHRREYEESVPPRVRSAPRTCSSRARRPPREREESVQRPALRWLRSRSARAPPRTCTPSARLAHRIPVSMSPRARISTASAASPHRARLPHRIPVSTGTRCLPARAPRTARAALLLGLAPPCERKESLQRSPPRTCTARARGRGALTSYPTRRPRFLVLARVSFASSLEAGTERCAVQQTTAARIPLGAAAPSTRGGDIKGSGVLRRLRMGTGCISAEVVAFWRMENDVGVAWCLEERIGVDE
ncbi:hypothetical protein DFH09DRAFT_1283397 [Mycena vulgaris]|nr:hypothetical protein DFH09DRAFT_1283397 [Mycena vulgaris]